eukprot:UN09669
MLGQRVKRVYQRGIFIARGIPILRHAKHFGTFLLPQTLTGSFGVLQRYLTISAAPTVTPNRFSLDAAFYFILTSFQIGKNDFALELACVRVRFHSRCLFFSPGIRCFHLRY